MTSVATYNLGDGPDRKKLNDLHTLADEGARVIGLQEASDRGGVIEEFCDERPGWKVWSPRQPGAAAVPILYDTRGGRVLRTRVLRLRTLLAVASCYVGPGAGPSRAKAKAINIVVLRDRDGQRHRYINTHFIASATRFGKQYQARRNHYRAHARVIARVIGKGKRMRRTTVMGDFNAEPDFRLLAPVRATGIGGWTQQPTHGGRSIDHVLGPAGRRRVIALSSDHRAVITD